MIKERHKQQKDENFPVAFCLFPRAYRDTVNAYYKFAREVDDVADNPHLSSQNKLDILNNMERVLGGAHIRGKKFAFARCLREIFVKENFSLSLATDLLKAFRQDAAGFEYQTWNQLTEYCRYSAAPVGRFLLALYNESPSTYLPAASLCAALQIVNHIQDIGYDAKVLKRIYIPSEMMLKYHVKNSDLVKNEVTDGLRNCVNEMIEKVQGLLKEARVLPCVVNSKILRIEVFVIIYLTQYMIHKLLTRDFLKNDLKLSSFERGKALVKGVVKGLLTRKKTLSRKGI